MILAVSQLPVHAQVTQPRHETNLTELLNASGQKVLTNLLAKISKADLIICTNVYDLKLFNHHGFYGVITGDNVPKLIKTIASLKTFPPATLSGRPDLKLSFFEGTNYLAEVRIGGDLLMYGDDWFQDESGFIERVYEPYKKFVDTAFNRWQEEFFKKRETNNSGHEAQQTNKVPN